MIAIPGDHIVKQELTDKIDAQLNALIKPEWLNVTYGIRAWDVACCMEYVPPKETDVVLDIGCGESPFIFYIADYVSKVYGVDNGNFNNYQAWHDTLIEFDDYNNGKVEVITQNAAQLPYLDETFDKIYTFSALEHFADDDELACMKEVYRILKPNGIFGGTIDFNPITEYPDKDNDYVRTYTYESLVRRLIEPSGMLLLGEFHRLNPMPKFVNYLAAPMFFALVKDK